METIQIGPWIVKYDKEATCQAYSQIEIGATERCKCEPCQNFAAVREKVYPKEAIEIFNKLGIDYKKEVEVSHVWRISPGWHFYSGSFHFVGVIEEIIDDLKPVDANGKTIDYVPVNEYFSWYFCPRLYLPADKAFADQSLVQLDFSHDKVPWVLEVKEPEIDLK